MNHLKRFISIAALAVLLIALPLRAQAGDVQDAGFQKLELTDPPDEIFRESWLTANKMHMYFGLGSLLAAGITAITAPDDDNKATNQSPKNTTHYYAANTAAALGGAAIITGLYLHLDDIDFEYGFMDRDFLHMLLTIAGTAGYIYAISKAPTVIDAGDNNHSIAGVAGATMMATGIVLAW